MKNSKNTMERLQTIATLLTQQADGHELQSRIFKNQGFSKLAQKYEEHASEERGYVNQFVDRILDLGGSVKNQTKQETSIIEDAVDWIEYDFKVSQNGLEGILGIMDELAADITTYDLLKTYYKDEEEDMYWSEQQLDLIKLIGKENWLYNQM
ncbi:MAG: bacterioferritin [Coprobacillaceae bacterium]